MQDLKKFTLPKKELKMIKNNNQVFVQMQIIMTAFGFLSIFMEQNKEKLNDNFKRLFRKLAKVTQLYENKIDEFTKSSNEIIKKINFTKDVDYILVSVTIIAEYYEQLKGKKRYFSPLSFKKILQLQEEAIEYNKNGDIINDSMDFAELFVKNSLNASKNTFFNTLVDRENSNIVQNKIKNMVLRAKINTNKKYQANL